MGIVDFPDDEAAAEWLPTQARDAGLGTETLRGIPMDEAENLIARLSE